MNVRPEIAANGFALDRPSPQLQPQPNPGPNEFRLHDAKSQAGNFDYVVHIQGCQPHDPWSRNRP